MGEDLDQTLVPIPETMMRNLVARKNKKIKEIIFLCSFTCSAVRIWTKPSSLCVQKKGFGARKKNRVKENHVPVFFHLLWGEDLDQTVVPVCSKKGVWGQKKVVKENHVSVSPHLLWG